MLRFRIHHLSVLLTASAVVTLVLCWFGWKSLEQEDAIEKQSRRERLESAADLMTAGIRGKLAESGERLSGWVSNPAAPVQPQDGAVIFIASEARMEVIPRGALPYVPLPPPETAPNQVFAAAEAIEFGNQRLRQAAAEYRKLSRHDNPQIRAEALLRLGRVLRKEGDFNGAMEAYRSLAVCKEEKEPKDITAGGLPADLMGLDGQRLTSAAAGDHVTEQHIAAQIARLMDSGHWLLSPGAAEFYRDEASSDPKPESWLLAEALTRLWETESKGGTSAGSLRVFNVQEKQVLAIWRSNGQRSAALIAFMERFLAGKAATGFAYQLTDAGGNRIAGAGAIPDQTVARVIGDPQNPWMLRIWSDDGVNAGSARPGPTLLLALLAIVILFLWGTVYFMARAIRREAAVVRLQSDFVAAVSHEFRTPLTTVRQLSEMLEMGQVPSEERRQKYYQVLAGESRRLQRLVETLLNFGKMESGAQQYRFEPLEVHELVHRAVNEAASEEQATGRIEMAGPEEGIRLRGDAEALALALRNLIDNALKYSPAGEMIKVSWTTRDGLVSISVQDRGSGIPREEQGRIFEKFVRGTSAAQTSVKGTGIGLAMVRHILSAHGGEIRLESAPGCGSTFTMLLAEER